MIQLERQLEYFGLILSGISPRRILEIGTWDGEFTVWLNRFALEIITVDAPCPDMRLSPTQEARRVELFRNSPIPIYLVEGDSHLPSTRSRVKQLAGNEFLDLIIFDGDHSLAGLTSDLAAYAPLLGSIGWLAIHDTDSCSPLAFAATLPVPQITITSHVDTGHGWTLVQPNKGE